MYKFGKVTLVGRPNAGKSTLLNKLVGEKISIVSPKAQTTRDVIDGVVTTNDYQLVYIDTPGIHNGEGPLSKYMIKGVKAATEDVDVILYCIDGEKPVSDSVYRDLERYSESEAKLIAVITKLDRADKAKLIEVVRRLGENSKIAAIIPVSSYRNTNLDDLVEEILKYVPECEKMYDDDYLTDKPTKFIVAERIREKILYRYNEEIPHGVAVEIAKFDYDEDKNMYSIYADIIAEKEAHKRIIIGKNGEALKDVATRAREDLERFLDAKVFLEMFVKVKENWRDSDALTKEFGFDIKNFND